MVTPLLASSCVMPPILSVYALESTEAILVDAVVDRDRAKLVEPDTDRCLPSVRRHTIASGGLIP